MVRVLIGDLFESKAQTLVNTVNCVGVMGKGIAQEFKKRFPEMFEMYKHECDAKVLVPGKPSLYKNLFGSWILNFPTKRHWKSPTLVKDIENGLDYFNDHYKEWGVKAVAFPPLGCGNGGLKWTDVGPLMYEKLKDVDIPVEIYAPYGTPKEQLSTEFLQDRKTILKKKGSWVRGTLTSGEVAILEVLYRLQKERYARPIGRVMYQKASYILNQTGVETGFVFNKGDYGPFSEEAKSALNIFANNNLIREESIGKMMRLTVSEQYGNIRGQYLNELASSEEGIKKSVDLLSRIKNTSQGEEVATVIYAANILGSQEGKGVEIKDISDYILEWKKKWKLEDGKKESVNETIESLSMLNWISVKNRSEDLLPV